MAFADNDKFWNRLGLLLVAQRQQIPMLAEQRLP
jgi:hypothetical protein